MSWLLLLPRKRIIFDSSHKTLLLFLLNVPGGSLAVKNHLPSGHPRAAPPFLRRHLPSPSPGGCGCSGLSTPDKRCCRPPNGPEEE